VHVRAPTGTSKAVALGLEHELAVTFALRERVKHYLERSTSMDKVQSDVLYVGKAVHVNGPLADMAGTKHDGEALIIEGFGTIGDQTVVSATPATWCRERVTHRTLTGANYLARTLRGEGAFGHYVFDADELRHDAALPDEKARALADERRRTLERVQDLAPHEVSCACPQGGATFRFEAHAGRCPRRQVGEMIDALIRAEDRR